MAPALRPLPAAIATAPIVDSPNQQYMASTAAVLEVPAPTRVVTFPTTMATATATVMATAKATVTATGTTLTLPQVRAMSGIPTQTPAR